MCLLQVAQYSRLKEVGGGHTHNIFLHGVFRSEGSALTDSRLFISKHITGGNVHPNQSRPSLFGTDIVCQTSSGK